MGDPQRATPVIIGLAGSKGSGKTTIAELLAQQINATVVSFGAYVRSKTTIVLNTVELADLGAQLLREKGPRTFIDEAIAATSWNGTKPLIIEGIRHIHILDALYERFPQLRLVYIHIPDEVRTRRLEARDAIDTATIRTLSGHSTESEVGDLKARAQFIVDGTDADRAAGLIARYVADER